MDHRIVTLTVLMVAVVLMAGCTGQNGTTVPEKKIPETNAEETPDLTQPGGAGAAILMSENRSETIEGMQTESHETMSLNDTINIYLKENPTTGYLWNASVTEGLMIENDTYVADPVKPGIVGSGGMHYWLVKGIQKGNQTFNAIYNRPWEAETGDVTRYIMNISVI